MAVARDGRKRAHLALGEDALAALQSYDWPGNVRELRNVIERVLILAPGDSEMVLGAAMLPTEFLEGMQAKGMNNQDDYLAKSLRDAREAEAAARSRKKKKRKRPKPLFDELAAAGVFLYPEIGAFDAAE